MSSYPVEKLKEDNAAAFGYVYKILMDDLEMYEDGITLIQFLLAHMLTNQNPALPDDVYAACLTAMETLILDS